MSHGSHCLHGHPGSDPAQLQPVRNPFTLVLHVLCRTHRASLPFPHHNLHKEMSILPRPDLPAEAPIFHASGPSQELLGKHQLTQQAQTLCSLPPHENRDPLTKMKHIILTRTLPWCRRPACHKPLGCSLVPNHHPWSVPGSWYVGHSPKMMQKTALPETTSFLSQLHRQLSSS